MLLFGYDIRDGIPAKETKKGFPQTAQTAIWAQCISDRGTTPPTPLHKRPGVSRNDPDPLATLLRAHASDGNCKWHADNVNVTVAISN